MKNSVHLGPSLFFSLYPQYVLFAGLKGFNIYVEDSAKNGAGPETLSLFRSTTQLSIAEVPTNQLRWSFSDEWTSSCLWDNTLRCNMYILRQKRPHTLLLLMMYSDMDGEVWWQTLRTVSCIHLKDWKECVCIFLLCSLSASYLVFIYCYMCCGEKCLSVSHI